MDSRVNFKEFFEKCCIPPTDDAERAGYHGFISDNYVYNTNDRATLLSNYLMNGECLCSHLSQQFKTNRSSFKPWIAFLHILCSVSKHLICLLVLIRKCSDSRLGSFCGCPRLATLGVQMFNNWLI